MIPSKKDLKKREENLKKFKAKLIDGHRSQPITDKAITSLIRSAVRQIWMRCPVKLAFLYSKSLPDKNPDTRRKFKYQCEKCEYYFKQSDIEVDHIQGNHSLRTLDDIPTFCRSILEVEFKDLQILCKSCHKIKTHSEKNYLTFEEAVLDLRSVDIFKKYKKISDLRRVLEKDGMHQFLGVDSLSKIDRKTLRCKHLDFLKHLEE